MQWVDNLCSSFFIISSKYSYSQKIALMVTQIDSENYCLLDLWKWHIIVSWFSSPLMGRLGSCWLSESWVNIMFCWMNLYIKLPYLILCCLAHAHRYFCATSTFKFLINNIWSLFVEIDVFSIIKLVVRFLHLYGNKRAGHKDCNSTRHFRKQILNAAQFFSVEILGRDKV